MSLTIRLCRFPAVAMLAGAMLFAFACFNSSLAGPSLTATAAELGKILGNAVTIHVTPEMEGSPAVPLVCQAVIEAVQDVTGDAQSKVRLGRLLNVVVIEAQRTTLHEHYVTLKNHVLTIQTVNDPGRIPEMRSLVADVLKKIVQHDEQPQPPK